MRLKFQADADLNEDIVKGVWRRVPEIDFKTATVACLEGLNDIEVLHQAARENRILVTHDRRTMPLQFGEFVTDHECPGLLLVSKRTGVREVIDDIVLIWSASEADEYLNRMTTIPI